MNKDDCVIYEGAFFRIEWYYDSDGNSQPFDYYQSCDVSQKRKFLMLCQRRAMKSMRSSRSPTVTLRFLGRGAKSS